MKPTRKCIADMQAHALAEFPREACGLIVRGRYLPQANTAADPLNDFIVADGVWRSYEGRVQAVVHSHPHRASDPEAARIMPWPSKSDMQGQIATAVPWIIIATDGIRASEPIIWGDEHDVPELIGREFRHGVTDCYALVRDCYRTRYGVLLPEVPRDNAWWDAGENLYLDNLERNGFVRIDAGELKPGDGVLMQIRSPVPNHAGVVVENGLVLHHLQDRLSRREPLGPWMKHVTHALRHRSLA